MKKKRLPGNKFSLFSLLLVLALATETSQAQNAKLEAGLRFQKTLNLYYENGITVQYQNTRFLPNRLQLGFNYITSRLGSAIGSNALKQDNIFLSGAYLFRPNRSLQPFLRLNGGWFRADYESEIFKNLQNTSPLLSTEIGLQIPATTRLKTNISLGYNLITGNGSDGPGTLYPLFYQLSLTYPLLNPTSK